mmetsp:Transcript_43883/g.123975  ORF Transcript_43883/g.123975 Transcript_43883/m.123975 type:complete len:200 (+) Transcript_43883:343-942(+)
MPLQLQERLSLPDRGVARELRLEACARRDDRNGLEGRQCPRKVQGRAVLHPAVLRVGDDYRPAQGPRSAQQPGDPQRQRPELPGERPRDLLISAPAQVRGAQQGVVPIEEDHRLPIGRALHLAGSWKRLRHSLQQLPDQLDQANGGNNDLGVRTAVAAVGLAPRLAVVGVVHVDCLDLGGTEPEERARHRALPPHASGD